MWALSTLSQFTSEDAQLPLPFPKGSGWFVVARWRNQGGRKTREEPILFIPPQILAGIRRNGPESGGIHRNRQESTGMDWNLQEWAGMGRNPQQFTIKDIISRYKYFRIIYIREKLYFYVFDIYQDIYLNLLIDFQFVL
jgi:hypothetical protein